MYNVVLSDDYLFQESKKYPLPSQNYLVLDINDFDKTEINSKINEVLRDQDLQVTLKFSFWVIFKIRKDNQPESFKKISGILNSIHDILLSYRLDRLAFWSNLIISMDRGVEEKDLQSYFGISNDRQISLVNKIFLIGYTNNSGKIISDQSNIDKLNFKLAYSIKLLTENQNLLEQNFKLKESLNELSRIPEKDDNKEKNSDYSDRTIDFDHYKSLSASFNLHVIDYNLDQISSAITNKIYNKIISELLTSNATFSEDGKRYQNYFDSIETLLERLKVECRINFDSLHIESNQFPLYSAYQNINDYSEHCFGIIEDVVQNMQIEFEDKEIVDEKQIINDAIKEFNDYNRSSLLKKDISFEDLVVIYKDSLDKMSTKRSKLLHKMQTIKFNFKNYINEKKIVLLKHIQNIANYQEKIPKPDSYRFHTTLIFCILLWNSTILFLDNKLTASIICLMLSGIIPFAYYRFTYLRKKKKINTNISKEYSYINEILSKTTINKNSIGELYYVNRQCHFISQIINNLKHNRRNLIFIKQIISKKQILDIDLDDKKINLWSKEALKILQNEETDITRFEINNETYKILDHELYEGIISSSYEKYIEVLFSFNINDLVVSYPEKRIEDFKFNLKKNIYSKIIEELKINNSNVVSKNCLKENIKKIISTINKQSDFPYDFKGLKKFNASIIADLNIMGEEIISEIKDKLDRSSFAENNSKEYIDKVFFLVFLPELLNKNVFN